MSQLKSKTLSITVSNFIASLLSCTSLAFNYSSALNRASHSMVGTIKLIRGNSRFSVSMVNAIKLIGSYSGFAVLISQLAGLACACAQASLTVNCVRCQHITNRSSLLRSLRSLHGTPRKRGAP